MPNELTLPINQEKIEQAEKQRQIEQERKNHLEENRLEEKTKIYSQRLTKFKENFNLAIEDSYLTKGEQMILLGELYEMEKEGELPKEYKKTLKLLDKNVNWSDYGIPELEKEFTKNKLDIKVEPINTCNDGDWFTFLLGMSAGMALEGLSMYSRRRK